MESGLKISIIVPTYNCENKIKRCIESVINQSYDNYQLIIINDGSTDDTENRIKPYLKNEKITYISKKNGGVSRARNEGLKCVKGDVITFLDADDFYSNGYLESINKNFKDNDILLFGYHTIFDGKRNDIIYGKKLEGSKDRLFRELSKKNLFNPVCNKVYSRKIIGETIFNEQLDLGEDFLFFTECLYKAKNILYVDEMFYNYEISLEGLGFKHREDMFKSKTIALSMLNKMYCENNFNITDISKLYVRNYLYDFLELYINKKLNKETIQNLQNKAKKVFDFNSLEYKTIYKIVLKIFLSNSYSFIVFITGILNLVDKINKRRNFKIKR